jgi:hypothetical protein
MLYLSFDKGIPSAHQLRHRVVHGEIHYVWPNHFL